MVWNFRDEKSFPVWNQNVEGGTWQGIFTGR